MTQDHPITPSPDLVGQWWPNEVACIDGLAAHAARWGADQELEACVEWLRDSLSEDPQEVSQELRAARRPKPLSLKQQALEILSDWCEERNGPGESIICDGLHVLTIRQALEQLDD